MRRLTHSRPSPALVVAVLALVAALAGTAVAEEATTSKVTTKKVKKIAKKQAKKQINKLAPGLSVANAQNAANADRADSAAQVDTLQTDPENVPKTGATAAASPEVELLTYGPFTVYGKCYGPAAESDGDVYIKTTDAGAVFDSDGDELDGVPSYLNPGTLEDDRQIASSDAGANSTDADEETFDAVLGAVKLEGHAAVYSKNGTPVTGNGTYGAGDRCIFDAFGTQEGA